MKNEWNQVFEDFIFLRRGEPGTPKEHLIIYFLKTISSIFKTLGQALRHLMIFEIKNTQVLFFMVYIFFKLKRLGSLIFQFKNHLSLMIRNVVDTTFHASSWV